MPSANAGNEMPDTASVMPMRSGDRFLNTAETMPIAIPMTTDHTMLHTVSPSWRPGWHACVCQIHFREIELRIGNHVNAGQLLVVRREKFLNDERCPWRIVPDRLLRVLVELRLLGAVDRQLSALDVRVDL